MKAQKIKAIMVEPYHNRKIAEKVAESTGAKVVDFAQFPGALPDTDTYIKLIDVLVNNLAAALKIAMWDVMFWPIVACVLLPWLLVYLGLHVVSAGNHLYRHRDGANGLVRHLRCGPLPFESGGLARLCHRARFHPARRRAFFRYRQTCQPDSAGSGYRN